MRSIYHHLAGGGAWFTCGAFFASAAILDLLHTFDERPRLKRTAHFFVVLSIPLAALTGTPVSPWLAIPLAAAALAYAGFGFTNPRPLVRRVSAMAAASLAAVGMALELPWYLGPRQPSGSPPARVYILGDSLSAGGYGELRPWPQILASEVSAEIHDLSRDGATVGTALTEASEEIRAAPQEGTAIFIELGGNDLLGGTSADQFERSLERLALLARGDAPSRRTVVMMELPGLFGKWRFTAAQRRIASRHGVVLIPRRALCGLIFGRGFTQSDWLHLSQAGHERFARLARRWLGFADRGLEGGRVPRPAPDASARGPRSWPSRGAPLVGLVSPIRSVRMSPDQGPPSPTGRATASGEARRRCRGRGGSRRN